MTAAPQWLNTAFPRLMQQSAAFAAQRSYMTEESQKHLTQGIAAEQREITARKRSLVPQLLADDFLLGQAIGVIASTRDALPDDGRCKVMPFNDRFIALAAPDYAGDHLMHAVMEYLKVADTVDEKRTSIPLIDLDHTGIIFESDLGELPLQRHPLTLGQVTEIAHAVDPEGLSIADIKVGLESLRRQAETQRSNVQAPQLSSPVTNGIE